MWGGMWGMRSSPSQDDIFHAFYGDSSSFWDNPFGSSSSPFRGDRPFGAGARASAGRHSRGGQRAAKASAIGRKLPCSLGELYRGTSKKMKISREIIDATGRATLVEEILTIDVKPGWKKGTKITFAEKGNETPNMIPADLVFVVDEKPHPVFTRDGNDLVVTHRIPLAEALTGYTIRQATLDGRSLTVPIRSVIHPQYEEVVRREGMPISKDPSRKGSLRIRFDIEFPTVLTANQKSTVTRMFGTQRNMDKDDGHGENMILDFHIQCQPPKQAANRKVAATHGENSGSGRVIYIGSVPVCVGSS